MDPNVYAKVVIARFGGRQTFFEIQEREHQAVLEAWDQDSEKIGRVIRAHLFVDYFLTRFLEMRCPGLAPVDEARLSFAQKTSLLRADHPVVGPLRRGISQLNIIRNRIAHSLKADVRESDADVFRGIEIFAAMRVAGGSGGVLSSDPVSVVESFAQFAGMILAAVASPHAELWSAEIAEEELRAATEDSGNPDT